MSKHQELDRRDPDYPYTFRLHQDTRIDKDCAEMHEEAYERGTVG